MVNKVAVTEIADEETMQQFVAQHEAAAVYFSGADCGVCQVLQPQLQALLAESYPRMAFGRVATEQATELAAQHGVFAVPTLLIFFDGRESFRYARNFSMGEVDRDIARPYALFFD